MKKNLYSNLLLFCLFFKFFETGSSAIGNRLFKMFGYPLKIIYKINTYPIVLMENKLNLKILKIFKLNLASSKWNIVNLYTLGIAYSLTKKLFSQKEGDYVEQNMQYENISTCQKISYNNKLLPNIRKGSK